MIKTAKPWHEPEAEVPELTDAQYFEAYDHYMTSHKLECFYQSPRAFHWLHTQKIIPPKDSSAFVPGGAFHCYVLEGQDAFCERYLVSDGPINPKTDKPYGRDTQKFAAWLEEVEADGKTPITHAELDQIQCMAMALEDHPVAPTLLEDGSPEMTIRAKLFGVPCQSRIDWLTEDEKGPIIVDLKTTKALGTRHTAESPCKFVRDAFAYGYDRQMAFYQLMATRVCGGELPRVCIIAVEKSEPHPVGVFWFSERTMRAARAKVESTMVEFKRCLASREFPTRFEKTIII